MSAEEKVTAPARRVTRKRARRANIFGIFGEVFITAGVLVILFLGWQLWLNDIIVGGQQNNEASALGQEWALPDAPERPEGTAPDRRPDPGEPVFMAEPGNATKFGILMVPRWGADFERTIAQGVGLKEVLNRRDIGIGHYPGTQMPGQLGNFALAAHRTTYGGAFKNLHELQVGDHIYVETEAGWYSYVFRSLEYVLPTGVGVIEPVPQRPGTEPGERYITLTTCNPMISTAERLIAYGVLDTWYPRADGPPIEIAATVAARTS